MSPTRVVAQKSLRPKQFGGGFLLLLVLLRGSSISPATTVFAGEPRPSGPIKVARPTIFWRVWPGVRSGSIVLDGKRVSALYEPGQRAVVYNPPAPLAPGDHRVRCEVSVGSQGERTVREWSFVVSDDAIDALPATVTAPEAAALRQANLLRARHGLGSLEFDGALQAAANAHTAYLVQNRAGGHAEERSRPGFSGATPRDRASAYGAVYDAIAENVAVQSVAPARSLDVLAARATQDLFDAPYHRLAFLNPNLARLGAAFRSAQLDGGRAQETYQTLVFGGMNDPEADDATVLSPADGQTEVPVSWDGQEIPNPLRVHPEAELPTGYPLVFARFSPRRSGDSTSALMVRSVSLRDPAGDVPVLVNTPAKDPELMGQAVLIIPRRPLRPGTIYRVQVVAYSNTGQEISRSWKFTTAAHPTRRSEP